MLLAWQDNHAPTVSLQLWVIGEADSIIKAMVLGQGAQRFKVTV